MKQNYTIDTIEIVSFMFNTTIFRSADNIAVYYM